jgi:hypothetical protein
MKLATIDDIGKSVAADLKELFGDKKKMEERRKELQPELKQVWDALEAGQTVNGFTSKTEWAEKYAKVTIRYCQYIVKDGSRKNQKRELSSPAITAHLNNVEFDAERAYCVIEFEQKHGLKYKGKRRSQLDASYPEDNGNPTSHAAYEKLVKEGKIVWTHTVRDVSGSVSFEVENEDGTLTEKDLVAALRKEMTATLKFMRLWADHLTEEFDAAVDDRAESYEEDKERRSRSAKRAAETRTEKKEAAQAIKDRVAKANKQAQSVVHSYAPESGGKFSRCGLHNLDENRLKFATDDNIDCPACITAVKAAAPTKKKRFNLKRSLALTEANDAAASRRKTHAMATNGLTMCSRNPDENTLLVNGDQEPTCSNCSYEWGIERDKKLLKKAPVVDKTKDSMKRFRAAKKAAKFYVGMMKELEAVDGKYAGLLSLYSHSDRDGFPWTPPQPFYSLPKTEKEFQAEYDKAISEFDAVLAEGEAMGILTTAPREKTKAAAVDGADKSWTQKVVIPGSPEQRQWAADVAYRREHPCIDPNADDEFAGEGD